MRNLFFALILSAALASPAFAAAPRAADLPAVGNGGPAGPSVQAQCGAQWRAEKPELSAKGYTWPRYHSACAAAFRTERKAAAAPAREPIACTTDSDCVAKNPGL
jgi:hypothetical protein